MSEPKLFWYEQPVLHDPIAIIGFPSIGLVGSIASSFISRELKLKVVAGMTFEDIQQYTVIQNGEAYPPVRIYAGPVPKAKRRKTAPPPAETATEGETVETPAEETVKETPKKRMKSRDLIVVTSEVAAKPEFTYKFTLSMIETVKEMGAKEIIFIDGMPSNDPSSRLMAAFSTENAKKRLEEAGIDLMNDGIIRGMSGVGIYNGKMEQLDTICILAPANPQLPDPRAAASTLVLLEGLVPRLSLDTQPLIKEAEDLENRLRAQQTQQSMINQNLYG